MAVAAKKQSALFPDMPRSDQAIDPKTGRWMPEWMLFFSQLSQALQSNYQREGIKVPQQESADITEIDSSNSTTIVGNIIYDSDTDEWKGIQVDTVSPFTTKIVTFQVV